MLETRTQASLTSVRDAYNAIYATRGIRQLDSFYIWLLSLLKGAPGHRFLDISCGEGTLLRFAREAGLEAHGLELSPVAAGISRREAFGTVILIANGEQLPYPDDTFDYVTNIGSLEHFHDPAQGIREIARVLYPCGRACILLPNLFGLFGNILSVWHTGDVHDDGQPVQRYATLASWRRLLEANDLRVIAIHRYDRPTPRTWPDVWWYLHRPVKLARLAIASLIPLNLANCLVFLCQTTEGGNA